MRDFTKHLRFFLASVLAAGLLAALSLTMSAAFAQGPVRDLSAQSANIYAGGGGSLSAANGAGMAASVANFLATKGHGAATLDSLVLTATHVDPKSGVTHLKFGQEVAGLGVYGTYVKAAIDGDGNLIHLIENLAELSGRGVAAAAAAPRDALNEAMLRNHPGVIVGLVEGNRSGNVVSFSGGGFFHRDPTVTSVAIAMENGPIKAGFLVETWTASGNMLHHTLVGGSGGVLGVELRTNNDRYNIFPDHPDNSSQTLVDGPDAPNAAEVPESPEGWLSLLVDGSWSVSAQRTVDIVGNNAHAYLDTDANNSPDDGGTPVGDGSVGDGDFLTPAVLTDEPSTDGNKEVAVQNLFYFNNVIHDKLYGHGFTESAGNFQEHNFVDGGDGGAGSDSVNAEAQDGSGTDNANFATPPDGSNPRMQMFLWNHGHVVEIGVDAYFARGAVFGPALDANGITKTVVAAIDGTDITTDACEELTNPNEISGNIALIDRGICAFVDKVKNAQEAGAIGVIIANNAGDGILTMGGSDTSIEISSVFIGKSDGGAIRDAISDALLPDPPEVVTATLRATPPMRDGDVDSDIIWHEYGHGLTWRMIGSMSGDMSGAIGEGMSDALAILVNENDVVGEYSYSSPIGIRSAPYTKYGRHYEDMLGDSVHFDGEIYAATIWRLWERFQANDISQDTLFDYLIGGMKLTPAGPAMEHMRDGILQAVAGFGFGHECLIWRAFADFGIGVGAEGTTKGGGPFGGRLDTVTESHEVPAECSGDLVLAINAGLTVAEGADGDITNSLLLVLVMTTVPNMITAEIEYTVTTPENGKLLLSGSLSTTFTQANINAGLVSYEHIDTTTTEDSFVFTVSVSDGDGGSIGPTTFDITVTGGGGGGGNTAPQVNAGDDATIDEGGTFLGSGSFTDPDDETWTATVDYGEGVPETLTLLDDKTFILIHEYTSAANSPYTVTVTVSDDTDTGSDTLVVTVLTVDGGTGSIRGTVRDKSGSKVQGVLVKTDNTDQSATTNKGGKYNLKDVPAGILTLTASKNDCEVKVEELEVTSGNTLTVDVVMACLP